MRPPVTPRRVAPLGEPLRTPRPDPQGTGPRAPRPGAPDDAGVPSRDPGAQDPRPADGLPDAPASVRPAADAAAPAADVVPADVVPAVAGWRPVRPAVVSDAAARFAERAAARRHVTRRRVLGALAAVLVAAGLGWLLLVSPVLALDVDEVVLEGQGTVVDASRVAEVVAPHDGTPLPRLDTVALRRAVLDVPGVRAAEVARVWPHGLHITVVSREPVVAVPQAEGGVALLDVEGVQVGRADAAPDGLPVVEVPLDDPGARTLTAVLTVLQQLPPELGAQVATVAADSQDTVRFVLADGVTVEWGSADRTALKARVLQALRAAPASSEASHYDVSAPEAPITRS